MIIRSAPLNFFSLLLLFKGNIKKREYNVFEEMKNNRIDGAFVSSYKKEREVFGKYPIKDGKPDETKRIHTSGYSLYVLKGSNVNYDGTKLLNVDPPVGVQRGFSIVSDIFKMGHPIDEGTADPESMLKKLKLERNSAVVAQTARADKILEENADLASKIIKIELDKAPFGDKPYFIMLSHEFTQKYPEFSKEFWEKCDKVRNSKEYKAKAEEFYKKYQ